jgi:Cdc6-like AAA superfamily ATPase
MSGIESVSRRQTKIKMYQNSPALPDLTGRSFVSRIIIDIECKNLQIIIALNHTNLSRGRHHPNPNCRNSGSVIRSSVYFLSVSFHSPLPTLSETTYLPTGDDKIASPSGILLVGAPGSGRTSIAKEVGRRLSFDSRVFAC